MSADLACNWEATKRWNLPFCGKHTRDPFSRLIRIFSSGALLKVHSVLLKYFGGAINPSKLFNGTNTIMSWTINLGYVYNLTTFSSFAFTSSVCSFHKITWLSTELTSFSFPLTRSDDLTAFSHLCLWFPPVLKHRQIVYFIYVRFISHFQFVQFNQTTHRFCRKTQLLVVNRIHGWMTVLSRQPSASFLNAN